MFLVVEPVKNSEVIIIVSFKHTYHFNTIALLPTANLFWESGHEIVEEPVPPVDHPLLKKQNFHLHKGKISFFLAIENCFQFFITKSIVLNFIQVFIIYGITGATNKTIPFNMIEYIQLFCH